MYDYSKWVTSSPVDTNFFRDASGSPYFEESSSDPEERAFSLEDVNEPPSVPASAGTVDIFGYEQAESKPLQTEYVGPLDSQFGINPQADYISFAPFADTSVALVLPPQANPVPLSPATGSGIQRSKRACHLMLDPEFDQADVAECKQRKTVLDDRPRTPFPAEQPAWLSRSMLPTAIVDLLNSQVLKFDAMAMDTSSAVGSGLSKQYNHAAEWSDDLYAEMYALLLAFDTQTNSAIDDAIQRSVQVLQDGIHALEVKRKTWRDESRRMSMIKEAELAGLIEDQRRRLKADRETTESSVTSRSQGIKEMLGLMKEEWGNVRETADWVRGAMRSPAVDPSTQWSIV